MNSEVLPTKSSMKLLGKNFMCFHTIQLSLGVSPHKSCLRKINKIVKKNLPHPVVSCVDSVKL